MEEAYIMGFNGGFEQGKLICSTPRTLTTYTSLMKSGQSKSQSKNS
jgi:hypothetical protein